METAAARVRVKGTAFRGNLEMPRAERASVPPQNANNAFRGPRVAGNRSRDRSDQRAGVPTSFACGVGER